MKSKTWYPIENGKAVIEIQLYSLSQLFDERDPAPFRLKDLDDDAVEFIVSSADEIGEEKVGKLRVYFVKEEDKISPSAIPSAVHEHFRYRAEIQQKVLSKTLRVGLKSLTIGVTFLAFAVFVSKSLSNASLENFWGYFVQEGILLLGWVSMWKPVNIFLYEWWPLKDAIKTFQALGSLEVETIKVE